jgi:phenylalanyl-tRNA synthetase beta chain
MTGSGFSEVITYSFIPSTFPSLLGLNEEAEAGRLVRISNPLTEDQAVMRTTLIFNLLDTMVKNKRTGVHDLKIFEIGRVYFAGKEGDLPVEKNRIGCLLTGLRYNESWHSPGEQSDFYDLKGLLENIIGDLKLPGVRFSADVPWAFLHPGRSCRVYLGDSTIGYLGEVHPRITESMDLRNRAVVFELDLDEMIKAWDEGRIDFREVSKFPSSTRDVAFVVSQDTEGQRLLDVAFRQDEELLEKVSIFDVYTGKNIPDGTRSLGLRFSYRSWDRTLTDEEVNESHSRIVKAVIEETQAKIRE